MCDENDYESACCHKCNEEKVLPARGIDIIDAKKMRVIALANKKARKQTRDRWYYSSNKEDIWLEVKDDEV